MSGPWRLCVRGVVEESMSATMMTSVAAPEAVRDVAHDTASERWSARRTMAFVVLVCGVFWLGVGALVMAAIRAF